MDIAHDRSLGFAGKEILFRKIEFERYRKPHVVEYPRSAIVLNPQHTRQLKDSFQHHHDNTSKENREDETSGDHQHPESDSDEAVDDDDPRRSDEVTQLCSDDQLRSSLHLRWQHITPVGLGLVNLGNTCFANCVLQAFAHIPALAQYFMITFRSADNQLGAPFDFCFALAETFRQMHRAAQHGRNAGNSTASAYRPGPIVGNLRLLSKHFSIGRQSDAHEFAVQLLFACQKSLLHRLIGSKKVQPRVAHTTALYRICGGYLLSQVTWSRQEEIQQLLRAGKEQEAIDLKMEAKQAMCRKDKQHRGARHGLDIHTLYSNTYDPFTLLSVELAGRTLLNCLDRFCLAEELDGRSYHTPREVGVHARKKFSIHIPPPVLMIHLKRFGPTGNKINKHIQFPLELDITRYCTPHPSSSAKRQQSTATSSSSPFIEKAKREDCLYELNAICVHEGSSINYGHYYTMAKASNGMWYEFNDSHVSRLSEEQLQRAQAYLLCYSCIPVKKAKPAEQECSLARERVKLPGSLPSVMGGASTLLADSMPVEPAESEDAVGRELSEVELQALLEKRRHETQSKGKVVSTATADTAQTQNTNEASEHEKESIDGSPQMVSRVQNLKRSREELSTDSDSDGEAGKQRNGTYLRCLRPPPGQRQNGPQQNHHSHSKNTSNNTDTFAKTEAEEDEDDATAHEKEERTSGDRAASSANASSTVKSSRYGGLIKSMKRIPRGADTAVTTNHSNSDGNVSNSTYSGSNAALPNYRVGRHAVSALHARKMHNIPDTVKRPATAPKFQQRIRDPMWEMEMDRGKVKKVRSKEKAVDLFRRTNPFQEASRGMLDVRGKRRRD